MFFILVFSSFILFIVIEFLIICCLEGEGLIFLFLLVYKLYIELLL